jgi:hypothetical protein
MDNLNSVLLQLRDSVMGGSNFWGLLHVIIL